MSILVVGLSFKRAPLDLLERLAFDTADLPKALHAARSSEHVREAVILSTCNRSEVYAVVTGYHAGLAALKQFFSEFHHVPVEDFSARLYSLYEHEAVSHLFSVASGIESMVVGEPQILTQVRKAFRTAVEEEAVGPTMSALFRHAISVGRRVRAETEIGRSAATLALAGATIARRSLGRLDGKTVVVVGAGKMSDVAAVAIAREGAHIIVANRTASRAESLARRAGGRQVAMAALSEALDDADLVLASTGSPDPVITREMVAASMTRRPERPMMLVDLAVPRDVERSVAQLPNVEVYDLDDLRMAVSPDSDQLDEVERVRAMVAAEVPRFIAWQRAHAYAPLIGALQERAERARALELRRARATLEGLDDVQRKAVDALTRSIVNKLLHDPMTRLKAEAGTVEGEQLARAFGRLFALEEDA